MASAARLYANLHLAADRQPLLHPTSHFFTGQMPFLPPNQQCKSTELQKTITYFRFYGITRKGIFLSTRTYSMRRLTSYVSQCAENI